VFTIVSALLAVAPATGCSTDRVPDRVTYGADVAPIIRDRCVDCHHSQGMAPFPLSTYEEARERAHLIVAAVRERRMPPWLPGPSDYPLAGDRRLTEREITILQRWAEQDAQPGRPAPPVASPANGWTLGAPDLILELPEPYNLAPGSGDVFRNFVLPVPLERTRHVRAVELHPGDARVVHHVVLAVDTTAASRQDDRSDGAPGFDGMFSRRAARTPDGFVIGWTPGAVPRPNPDGLAWPITPGSDIVVQMHLRPHSTAASVQPRIGLYFTDTPPARTPVLLRLGSQTLDIPAGDADYVVTDSLRLPVAVELLSVYPHAHYLGRIMDVRAVLPGGDTRQLLRIDDWNFNWQDVYTFAEPVRMPAGTTLHLRYVYDNSASNPRNPRDPPQRVVYGPQSDDEMAELWVQAVPRAEVDLVELRQTLARKSMRDRVEGWQHLVRLDPDDAVAHANLAAWYVAVGEKSLALKHYGRALEAEPDFAAAHYNLGLLLEADGSMGEALRHYRAALRTRPDHAGTHNNLGNVLASRGERADAAHHFRRAIELDSTQPEPHNNLGRLLWQEGRNEEAIGEFRRALAVRPDAPAPYFNLALVLASMRRHAEAMEALRAGERLEARPIQAYLAIAWLLATHGDDGVRQPREAARLAEQAESWFGGPHPRILDVRAAAEAAAGRFDRAIELARQAVTLADRAGLPELAAEVRERLALYGQGRPYVDPAGGMR
jgi:tetratricopeptide (TPR) repeat protein